jgi:hypothetical protein
VQNLIQLLSLLAIPGAVLLYVRWQNRQDAHCEGSKVADNFGATAPTV